jgi:hypothetical protein
MKKIYVLLTAATLFTSAFAQNPFVVDFENSLSDPETYNNGSDGSGDFTFYFDQLILTNYYNDAWGSWNGFSISNITDNTTAGWGNQYASFTGSGYNSSTYAIFYPSGEIAVEMGLSVNTIDSFFVTNTAYTALSMRDGDLFSKQFGSIYNAAGEVDGTNGEDFLRLWIIAEGWDSQQKDSVEVYLADYRFEDDQDDYIVDSWQKIDLTQFGFYIRKISFRFESSDMGDWGINTPTYFAIDDIHFLNFAGLDELAMNVSVYPNPVVDNVIVKGERGNLILTDLNGNVILTERHYELTSLDLSHLTSGVYLLTIENDKGQTATRKLIR